MNWLLPVLSITFTVLKLTGHIDWSWWWVYTPVIVYWLFHIAMSIWKAIDPYGYFKFWKS